jgi:regulator of cell morphogenesis and NO signaling
MNQTNLTDIAVYTMEPRLRHPLIFKEFDALNPGHSIRIINDHDPKPLYYQLLAERGPVFKWIYEERGPELWKVLLEKVPTDQKEITVGEITAKDIRKAEVFSKYGIDFCCGGNKSLKEVCRDKNISIEQISMELENIEKNKQTEIIDFKTMDLSDLCTYIVEKHHHYVRETSPILEKLLDKISEVHGANHPELNKVRSIFRNLAAELSTHMMKEERILFPYIMLLSENHKNGVPTKTAPFGSVDMPIRMMMMEHDSAGDFMNDIREGSNTYLLPADACNSYKSAYRMLSDFEHDLMLHIHLENNILFPRASELEHAENPLVNS